MYLTLFKNLYVACCTHTGTHSLVTTNGVMSGALTQYCRKRWYTVSFQSTTIKGFTASKTADGPVFWFRNYTVLVLHCMVMGQLKYESGETVLKKY